MDIFNLSAILTLDTSQYEQSLNGIGEGIGTVAKVGGAALAGATAAVTAFAAASVSTGMDFDKAMSQVQATMLKTNEEMVNDVGSVSTAYGDFTGNLREFAQFLGSNTAFSATQAAEALNYMALAGYSTQESMEMLPNVMSLAAAGNMDLARASDMVTDAQTAFGLSSERTSQMVDEMAKAASTGNTSVEQLGDAFLVVGGLAKELNGGFVTLADGTQKPVDGLQEMEIALTAMANAGIKGSEAGTHMRNMIMKLSNPTKEGAKWMEKLGLNVYDASGNMRSMKDIFGDLSQGMEGLTQQEKIDAIGELFNARDLSSAEALLAAIGADWDEIGAAILDSEGAASNMAQIQLDNLAGDITLFKSALEGAQILISDQLSPTLREFTQFGTESISTLSEAFKEGGLSGAMEALGTILSDGLSMVISKVPNLVDAGVQLLGALVTGIAGSLPTLGSAAMDIVTQLYNSIIENGPTFVSSFEQLVTDATTWISENANSFLQSGADFVTNVVTGFLNEIPNNIDSFTQIVTDVINGIGEVLPDLMETGGGFITNLLQGFNDSLPDILDAARNSVADIAGAIAENLPDIIDKGVEIVTNLMDGIGQEGPNIITKIGEVMTSLIGGIMDHLPTILQKGIEIVGQLGQGLINNIPGIVFAITSVILQIIAEIVSHLPDFLAKGAEIVGQIGSGVLSMVNAFIGIIKGIIDRVKSAFDIDWGAVGSGIIDGIKSGIASAAGRLASAAIQAAKDALNAVKGFLGISSPSKLFKAQVGKQIPLGMALGIEQGIPDVVQAVDDMNDEALEDLDDIGYDARTMVRGTKDPSSGISEKILEALYMMSDAIGSMDDAFEDKMSSALSSASFSIDDREFGRLVRNVRTA